MNRLLFVMPVLVAITVSAPASQAAGFNLGRALEKVVYALEEEIGRNAAAQLEREKGIVTDAQLNARLQNVALRLIPKISRKDISYRVGVLNDSDFNAAALPGGYVYVNCGLLRHVVSDDELAFVLSHEFSHISGKHGLKRLAGMLGLRLIDRLLHGQISESDVGEMAVAAIAAKFSREDEREADLKGVELMIGAGYDPAGALTAMRRMETLQREQPDIIAQFFATHPPPQDRSEYLKDAALRHYYGSTFRLVQSQDEIATSFDWPVGPTENCAYPGAPLDRDELRAGGWYVSQPWLGSYQKPKVHAAIDVNLPGLADVGQPVFAVARGTVLDIHLPTGTYDDPWGGIVLVAHTLPDGTKVASEYAHLGQILVKKGQSVLKGELLGRIGQRVYRSSGPHLHFEIRTSLAISITEDPYRKDEADCEGWVDPEHFIRTHRGPMPVSTSGNRPDVIPLEAGPIHLGDDTPDSKTMWTKEFELTPHDLEGRKEAIAVFKLRATPRKDPVISFNRVRVGVAVASQTEWQEFRFSFDPAVLRPARNLVDLETVIPDLWQTFDDCEFSELVLLLH